MKFSEMHDFDLSFLREAARLVDARLQFLDEDAAESEDPDQFGIYDSATYITGFGFVACQTYMAACIARTRLRKCDALDLGPRHSCGQSVACLVNALANYWKHFPEWAAPLSSQAQQTIDTISTLHQGVMPSSYVVANSLHTLLHPNERRIESLIPLLEQWNAVLSKAA